MKIYLRPDFQGPDRGEGGIRRWVEAQRKYLPKYDIELVDEAGPADMVVVHAGDVVNTNKPLIAHCHGLYATAEQSWDRWAWMLNSYVIENLRRANKVTVPSSWVANQVARGMSIDAEILYAGVDIEDWQPTNEHHNYVLWNKTRVDPVCDPGVVVQLAHMMPDVRFLSTYGREQMNNLRLTGRLPFPQAKDLIQRAGVYLCTARETFGIGTLEAMAAGVPIVGWAWGGQMDIVDEGINGYLVPPGDYKALEWAIRAALNNREELGMAGRDKVSREFTWPKAIAECAGIYQATMRPAKAPRTTVIVTCYNLEKYLVECLNSVRTQSDKDWDCLVVDDCSPGNCREIVERFSKKDKRFSYIKTPRNLYLAGARNFGIKRARGSYIMPLDADDMLGERALTVLGDFLDGNPGYAIAYGSMQVIEDDKPPFVSGWPQDFSWEGQMATRNQLPYASMYRREVWERTGGYRERCHTSEDNDFWCRVSSFGYKPKRATGYPTLIYRNRPDSMSHANAWPDCTIWYGWARNRAITPFGAVGKPSGPLGISWPVRTYAKPEIAVVIPVGPSHQELVRDALDSLLAQSFDNWEAIVVNDSGTALNLAGFPWVREIKTSEPKSGPAIARNIGIGAARAPLFALLDADDYYMPDYLQRCYEVYKQFGGYVYTDWFQMQEKDHEYKKAAEFEVGNLVYQGLRWTITALFPKEAWEEVGGFDPTCGGWEDWDFYFNLAVNGYCGTRVPQPLWCYRYISGKRREAGYANKKANAKRLRTKWKDYIANGGEKLMGCRGCGKGGGGKVQPSGGNTPAMRQIASNEVAIGQAQQSGMVLMRYVGNSAGTQTIKGPRSGKLYRFGGTPSHRERLVYAVDVAGLEVQPFLARAESLPTQAKKDGHLTPMTTRNTPSRLMEPEANIVTS